MIYWSWESRRLKGDQYLRLDGWMEGKGKYLKIYKTSIVKEGEESHLGFEVWSAGSFAKQNFVSSAEEGNWQLNKWEFGRC